MSDTFVIRESDPVTQRTLTYGTKRTHAWTGGVDSDRLRSFLIGLYPEKTAENVASETGVPFKTVKRWLSDAPGEPSLVNFLRLWMAYRTPFLAAVLESCPRWLDDEARRARADDLARQIADAQSERARLLARQS